MRKLLLVLLIVFVATQKRRPRPPRPDRHNIISSLNVTKAAGFELRNNTENYLQEVAKLDIPQKIKDMVSKVNVSKKEGKYSDLKLDYNNKTGGNAKGEFYLLRKGGRKKHAYVEFYYGTAVATLKPLKDFVEVRCYGRGKNRKCRNVTHKAKMSEKEIRGYVERRMRMEIKLKVIRRRPRPRRNRTRNGTRY